MKVPARRLSEVPLEIADDLERRGVTDLVDADERRKLIDAMRPKRRQSMDMLKLFIRLVDADVKLLRLDDIEGEIERAVEAALDKEREEVGAEADDTDDLEKTIEELKVTNDGLESEVESLKETITALQIQLAAANTDLIKLKNKSGGAKGFF